MTDPLDVIIIGAGSAGLSAQREVRKRTERFVLINEGPYGTTCARDRIRGQNTGQTTFFRERDAA